MNIKQTEMEGGGWQHIKRRDGAKRQHTGMNMKQVEFSSRRRGGGLRLVDWSITRSSMTLKHTQGHGDKSHRRQHLSCSSSSSSGTASCSAAVGTETATAATSASPAAAADTDEECYFWNTSFTCFNFHTHTHRTLLSVCAARFKCQSYFR